MARRAASIRWSDMRSSGRSAPNSTGLSLIFDPKSHLHSHTPRERLPALPWFLSDVFFRNVVDAGV